MLAPMASERSGETGRCDEHHRDAPRRPARKHRASGAPAAPTGRHRLGGRLPWSALRGEYGWDESFEALVAEIAARFVKRYQPKRERCWIAERAGQNVGSVFWSKDLPLSHSCGC
jgi:hypothetical protein